MPRPIRPGPGPNTPLDPTPPDRARFDADIRTKLADNKVDTREAKDLVTGWSATKMTQAQADQLKASVNGAKSTFDLGGARIMEKFVRDTLPTLVIRTPIGLPANSAKLSWTPPTTNVDGTPLTDLKGYKVCYGPSPGNYTNTLELNDPAATSFQVNDLPPGTWYFAMKSVDTAGNESGFSNEASKTIR